VSIIACLLTRRLVRVGRMNAVFPLKLATLSDLSNFPLRLLMLTNVFLGLKALGYSAERTINRPLRS
jgi:hypothetical protein